MAQKKKASRKTPKSRAHHIRKASRLFLPYPLFTFLMLCVGVLLALWTFKADAIDYIVNGKVPAPALTDPAIIESPMDSARFTAVPIKVSGSCPLESYVNLYRNDIFSGSVLCSASNRFEITTDLFEDANILKAKVFNLTDDEGPASDPITVYYDAPTPSPEPTPGSGPPSAVPAAAKPLIIKSEFKYRGYLVGQTVKWPLEISGGNAPYAVSVDWGDGESSLISLEKAGQFNIEHIYKTAPSGGSYEVKISASDKFNRKSFFQFFIIVVDENGLVPVGGTGSSGFPGSSIFSRDWLKYLWPAYGIVSLMVFSFWLGEREELIELRRQATRKKRRA